MQTGREEQPCPRIQHTHSSCWVRTALASFCCSTFALLAESKCMGRKGGGLLLLCKVQWDLLLDITLHIIKLVPATQRSANLLLVQSNASLPYKNHVCPSLVHCMQNYSLLPHTVCALFLKLATTKQQQSWDIRSSHHNPFPPIAILFLVPHLPSSGSTTGSAPLPPPLPVTLAFISSYTRNKEEVWFVFASSCIFKWSKEPGGAGCRL